jgi:hypothetical protein
MSLRRTLLLAALISMAPTALVVAQTTEPQSDPTSPSAASSPHQRDTTQSNAPEASSTDNTQGTSPSAASTPHQQQATKDSTRMASKEQMKECIAKQQADNSGMSKADAKKACKAQMKGPG